MFSPRLKILFVTGNAQKLADVKTYLGPYDIVVESALLDLPEVQAATVEEIAREKCRRAVEIVSMRNLGISFVFKMEWVAK
jgi:inosine triphosphate pyrophosphatase